MGKGGAGATPEYLSLADTEMRLRQLGNVQFIDYYSIAMGVRPSVCLSICQHALIASAVCGPAIAQIFNPLRPLSVSFYTFWNFRGESFSPPFSSCPSLSFSPVPSTSFLPFLSLPYFFFGEFPLFHKSSYRVWNIYAYCFSLWVFYNAFITTIITIFLFFPSCSFLHCRIYSWSRVAVYAHPLPIFMKRKFIIQATVTFSDYYYAGS